MGNYLLNYRKFRDSSQSVTQFNTQVEGWRRRVCIRAAMASAHRELRVRSPLPRNLSSNHHTLFLFEFLISSPSVFFLSKSKQQRQLSRHTCNSRQSHKLQEKFATPPQRRSTPLITSGHVCFHERFVHSLFVSHELTLALRISPNQSSCLFIYRR